jgi:PiT family inorganic phosphate transporter
MGIIYAALIVNGTLTTSDPLPIWVIFGAYTAIALGTLMGGWRVVKTMGMKLTKLRPFEGFSAESSSGFVLLFTALAGIPVSTTHTITGSIMGVGLIKRISAVRWLVANRIVWSWILTIPLTSGMAGIIYLLLSAFS